jgi:5'-3' exonuclease
VVLVAQASKVIIDGNNLLMTSLRNLELDINNPMFWFLSQLNAKMKLLDPSQIIVAWDYGRSWRRDYMESYKANRRGVVTKEISERSQIINDTRNVLIEKLLPALGVHQVMCKGYEADDLVGYFCHLWKDDKIVLISTDRDWWLLVTENVSILHKDRLNKGFVLVTAENYYEMTTWSNAEQYLLAKTAIGDGSDNIRGLDKIGPITIRKYMDGELAGSKKPILDDFYNNSELFQRNLKLMDIRAAVIDKPITVVRGKYNPQAIIDLLTEVGFTSLLSTKDKWLKTYEGLDANFPTLS